MRCDDVIRELAVPTGALDPDAQAEHLADCPQCASWAGRDAKLGRLWEATRPPALSSDAWDRIWDGVTEALDRPATPAVVPGPWRLRMKTAFAVAQAAAILLGVLLVAKSGPPRPAVPAPVAAPAPSIAAKGPSGRLEIDQDQLVMIRVDRRSVQVDTIARNENAGVDKYYVMFNELEAIASLQ